MKKPIYNALLKYIENKNLRMHMPGHKGKISSLAACQSWGDILRWDITEVSGVDNLNFPQSVILESQQQTAKLLGAKQAYYLVGGSTLGIEASILGTCNVGDKILLPRNCHRSVWAGITISGAVPVWIAPHVDEKFEVPCGVDLEKFAQTVAENPDAKVAFFVNPTYHGICEDLEKMLSICQENGIISIVDEAHGSHFAFYGEKSEEKSENPEENAIKSAISMGADLVINSWHKTLGSMTQTAILTANNLDIPVAKTLAMLQSSSPSYPLMLSLENTAALWCENHEMLMSSWRLNVEAMKNIFRKSEVLQVVEEFSGYELDFSKVLVTSRLGHSGWQIADAFRAVHIEPEMEDHKIMVLLTSAFDSKDDIEVLAKRIAAIEDILKKTPAKVIDFGTDYLLPEIKNHPRELLQAKSENLGLKDAVGRISAGLLVPYPPGITLVGIGEEISAEAVAKMEEILFAGGSVQGISENLEVEVVK